MNLMVRTFKAGKDNFPAFSIAAGPRRAGKRFVPETEQTVSDDVVLKES